MALLSREKDCSKIQCDRYTRWRIVYVLRTVYDNRVFRHGRFPNRLQRVVRKISDVKPKYCKGNRSRYETSTLDRPGSKLLLRHIPISLRRSPSTCLTPYKQRDGQQINQKGDDRANDMCILKTDPVDPWCEDEEDD